MDLSQTFPGSTKLLNEIYSHIRDVIILTDHEGLILHANPVAEKVFGLTPDELRGSNLSTLFTPEDLNHLYPNLLYMARREQVFEGELMMMRNNGARFFAFMLLRSFFDSEWNRTVIIFIIRDIDERKKAINKFGRFPYEDLIKLSSGIAHELRNPLVGIGGFVNKLYKSCKANSTRDKYYEYIIGNLVKIERLVEKVRFLTSLPKPDITQTSIRELIQEILHPYLQQIGTLKISLEIDVDDVMLRVDKHLITTAFSILIENALDVLSEGEDLLIRSDTKANQCEVYVSDTGRGISSKDLPYIFNPFFSTKAEGAGIGLAIVKRIMQSHGGNIEVKSTPGQGATFLLLFPLERRRSIRVFRQEDL